MPANKYALLRYRIIDKRIRNKYKPYPSKEDLRQACEDFLYDSFRERVSVSTLEKDLYAMRNEEGLGYLAPLKYSRDNDGYYYEDSNYSIDKIPLNEDDIEALKFAAFTLSQFKEIGIFNQFGDAIEKLMNRIELSDDIEDNSINQLVLFESSKTSKGSDYLGRLFSAIKHKQKVSFTYKGFDKRQGTLRELDPYLLKQYQNRWYVIGFEPKSSKIKTFGLDRIENMQLCEQTFETNDDFSKKDFFKYSIGITTGNYDVKKVLIEFSNFAAAYIESQPLHPTQKISKSLIDSKIFEYSVYETPELTQQILAWGNNAKVILPKSLKNKIVDELEKTSKNY